MKNIQIHSGKIPGRSAMYLLICVVMLIIFYFAAIYPYQRSLGVIDVKTAQSLDRIRKQKVLLPLYEEMIKKGEGKAREGLPLPEKKGLSRKEIDTVSSLFKKMADKYDMLVVSVSPDVATISEVSDDVMVSVRLRGKFYDFRKFLVELGGVPFLDRVEEIEITQETGHKEFYLKVWLTIE